MGNAPSVGAFGLTASSGFESFCLVSLWATRLQNAKTGNLQSAKVGLGYPICPRIH